MKTSTLLIVLSFCLGVLAFGIPRLETAQSKGPEMESLDFLPSQSMVRLLAPGHQETYAGLLWIQSVSYFGEAVLEGKSDEWYADLLKVISTLDPKLRSPYLFSALFERIPLKQSEEMIKKGLAHHPNDWQLHLFAAIKFINERKDYKSASTVMKKQKDNSKAPEYIRNIWKRYENNSQDINLEIILTAEKYVNAKGGFKVEFEKQLVELATKNRREKSTIENALELLRKKGMTNYNKGLNLLLSERLKDH